MLTDSDKYRPRVRAMTRVLIAGYCYGIRSERRLCKEAALNRAHRWSCRLGLEDEVPDRSAFSKTVVLSEGTGTAETMINSVKI